MKYSKQQVITHTKYGCDFVSLAIALFISIANTSASSEFTQVNLVDFFLMRFSLLNLVAVVGLVALWFFIFKLQGLYGRSTGNFVAGASKVAFATGIGTAVIAVSNEIFQVDVISNGFLAWFWPTSFGLTFAIRAILHNGLRTMHAGDYNVIKVLIIGTNEQAVEVAQELAADPLNIYQVMGYVKAGERAELRVDEDEIIADIVDASGLLEKQVVDEIVVALALRDISTQVEDLMCYAADLGITVRCPVNKLFRGVFGRAAARLETESMRFSSGRVENFLLLRSGYGFSWEFIAKRVVDYAGGFLMLLAASPIMIVAAIAIKLSSPGDVFFIQERYGYNGRIIRLFKFRTMGVDADAQQAALRAEHNEMDGGAFKMKNDPRVTRVGGFLRKTSIDELPQIFNVLLGEMSLVGPRPLPLADYEHFQQVGHKRRLSVLPGITCTWQAGGRNNLSFDEWMELDMAYIDSWSFLTDIKILLMTVPAVLFRRGAS